MKFRQAVNRAGSLGTGRESIYQDRPRLFQFIVSAENPEGSHPSDPHGLLRK